MKSLFTFPLLPGYSTNQLAFVETYVMKQMMQYHHSLPFREPVDAVKLEVPTYYDVIKEPMDFGTIARKLKANVYRSSSECLDDFSRVFGNCYAFNKTDSEMISAAKDLEEFLHEKLSAMPQPEFEIEVGAKNNIEGQQRREAAELQDYLSSYFSTREKGRKRNSVDRLVVGVEKKRRSSAVEHMSKEAKGRSNGVQTKTLSKSDGIHADNIKTIELGISSGDKHESECYTNDNLEKKIVKVSGIKTQKKFGQQGKSKATSKRKGKSSVKSKKGMEGPKKAGILKERQARREILEVLESESSKPSTSPIVPGRNGGALDPLLANMMKNIKEASKSHDGMLSTDMEAVMMRHSMNQMVKKLDLIKTSMELVQKNPVHAKKTAFEIQASVSKLEKALGKESERPRRANHAEHSRRSFTDWGEVAAKRKAGGEQKKENVGH